MKKAFVVTVLAVCSATVFAQKFSLSELIDLSNKNWDEFDTYVASKGFNFYNHSRSNDSKNDYKIQTYKYKYASDVETAPAIQKSWFPNQTKPNCVVFTTFNPDDYVYIKNQLKLLNFVYTSESGNGHHLWIDYKKGNIDVNLWSFQEDKYNVNAVCYTITLKTP